MSIRRLIPIAAFVAVLTTLVGVRVLVGNEDADSEVGTESTSDIGSTGDPAAAEIAGGIRFTDVTGEAGLAAVHSSTDLTGESAMTAGAAVADVDGDGDLDVYLTRVGMANRLMLNDGDGRFEDVAEAVGVAGNDPAQGSSAAAFADVDGDGDVDLVVTGAGTNGTVLYVNDGDGAFRDMTAGSGLDDLPPVADGEIAQMHGATFSDFDRDGRLDLLLTHWDDVIPAALAEAPDAAISADDADGSIVCARSAWLRKSGFPRADGSPPNRGRLYRNEGDGQFRDVSEQVGLPFEEILGFTGSFADVDGDGWDDLLVTGDFCMSRLFRNVDGVRFEDVTESAGVGTDENGMGSVIRDIDGDGLPDWFVTSIGPVDGEAAPPIQLGGFGSSGNRAYLNSGDGTFTDATDRLGLRNGGWGWGAAIEDFGNDGRLSVVMTNGYSTSDDDAASPTDDPLRFWVRPEGADLSTDGSFVEVSAGVGLDDGGLGRALVPFDMDRDGDLDLLVANFGAEPLLLRNDSPEQHWITVTLADPSTPGNDRGIGAKVVVRLPGGDAITQWIRTQGSYESQVPAEVHVGLGDLDEVDRIEVTWPDSDVPQVLDDVAVDQMVVVRRDPNAG